MYIVANRKKENRKSRHSETCWVRRGSTFPLSTCKDKTKKVFEVIKVNQNTSLRQYSNESYGCHTIVKASEEFRYLAANLSTWKNKNGPVKENMGPIS